MMKAVLQDEYGDETTMYVGETNIPEPKENEILIKVYCTALNQMDLLQRKGLYPLENNVTKILGVEVSGIIEKIGINCNNKFKIGQKCLALLNGGGYAEYVTTHECTVMLAENNLDMKILAAIPEQWITAYQLLFYVAQINKEDNILIHAGSSGVGQAAIQLIKNNGNKCFATCRDDEKVKCCLNIGATNAFNIKENSNDFANIIKSNNNNNGVDIILDPVGESYILQNIELLNKDGKLIIYGLLGGKGIQNNTFLSKLMSKRLSIITTTLRNRDYSYKSKLIEDCEKNILPKIINNVYNILIDTTFPMTTNGVREAHKRMAAYLNIGKIILIVREE